MRARQSTPRIRIFGFTLLEMVVAIGIFAIIAAIAYGSLTRFLDTRDTLTSRSNDLRRLQTTMMLIEQDLRYAISRSVRDGFGDFEAPMLANPGLELGPGEFIRLSTIQPEIGTGATHRIRRVAWRLNQGILSRVAWPVLDRDQDSDEFERRLLENVSAVTLGFMTYNADNTLIIQTEWEDPTQLPAGIEVIITLETGTQYTRIFEITAGST